MPVVVMTTVTIGSWAIAFAALGRDLAFDVLLGMIAPFVAAVVTWRLTERTHLRRPERLTAVMTAAFGGKMVFFGVYVAVMIRLVIYHIGQHIGPHVDPGAVAFIVSFTASFITLYAIEALYMRRLFASR